MSMIAKPGITAATEDVADTDDGDARITTDDFWPETELRALRLAVRLPGRTTTSRLMHAATEAVAHITGELRNWQTQQMNDGYRTLADVPASRVNGESVNVHRFRLAVYAATRALVLERVRDVDTTEQGDRKADALEAQTGDLWRDVRWAIADIQGAPRIFAGLC